MSGAKIQRTDKNSASVLVIENDPLMLTAISSAMNAQGHRAMMARTEKVAMELTATGQFDVVVLSIEELSHGCEFAKRLRATEATRDVPILFLVPELSPTWSEQLGQHGGVYSILKPFEPAELIELVERVLWMPHIAHSKLGSSATVAKRQRDWTSL